VDVSRGERIGRVSSEWFSRPADEQYLSLCELFAAVRGRAERSRTRTVETAAIRVEASHDDAARLALALPGADDRLVADELEREAEAVRAEGWKWGRSCYRFSLLGTATGCATSPAMRSR
jgi:hypothetical protein